jgi:hypothetical protein
MQSVGWLGMCTGCFALASTMFLCCKGWTQPIPRAGASAMQGVVEQFTADRMGLTRTYTVQVSRVRITRFEKLYSDELATLQKMNFDALSEDDKVDFLLLKNRVTSDQHQLAIERQRTEEIQPLIPFAKTIEELDECRRKMEHPDPEKAAGALTEMVKQIAVARKALDPGLRGEAGGKPKVNLVVANRAAQAVRQLSGNLREWFNFYNGYDPTFTWWVGIPYKEADKALTSYQGFLNERLIGITPDDKTTIIGDPVGRDALMAELQDNMIPYTPEEMIAIAQTEMDWCMKEMLRASREMGYGDDWHKALEHVKQMHVAPGEQPELIRKLVVQGSDFVKQNDMVTVPELADETWRMIMMTPERQLVNPFFTGGNEISV